MRKSTSRSAEYFNGLAGRWDEIMPPFERGNPRIEEGLAALKVRPADSVLDAGCGTGVLIPFLLSLVGPAGKVIGLDFSEAMIAEARRRYAAAALRLVCADVASFLRREAAGSVNAAVCFQAFPHFEEKKRVLKGFHRLLAPNGRLLILHFDRSDDLNAFHAGLPDPLRRHLLPPVQALGAWAREAGFAIIEAREEPGLYRLVAEKGTS